MTMTERKVIKAKVGLLELAKQLGSVTQGVVRLGVVSRTGSDTVARSFSCSRTDYITPYAEGSLPKGAAIGGRYEKAAKLEVEW